MNQTFAGAARQLAGLPTRAFGWTPDQFWSATPAELAAILSADNAADPPPLTRHEFDSLLERDANG